MGTTIETLAQDILSQLPVKVRDEAESLRAAGERERWASGDLSMSLIDELSPRYPKAAVRLAVAILFHCTDTTIRDREWVCRRVPEYLRHQYPDLTYHYWRACAQSRELVSMANEILTHKDAYGKMPSVNTVYGWLNVDNRLPVWVLRMGSILTLMSKIRNDPRLPLEASAVFDRCMELLGGLSASMAPESYRLSMPQPGSPNQSPSLREYERSTPT